MVDILAQVFPEEEDSVQVSLREKYSALLQRLRHCTLPGNAFPHAVQMLTGNTLTSDCLRVVRSW